MACPCFLPVAPLAGSPPSSPLGALFRGTCSAAPDAPKNAAPIDDALLLTGCNQGYARNRCPRAAASEVDAARFRIKSHASGVIEVGWSHERDHHPVAVGVLRLTEAPAGATPLEAQARACAAIYLHRKGLNW